MAEEKKKESRRYKSERECRKEKEYLGERLP